MKKRAAAAAITEAEERLREEGGSPGSAQLTHKAKRIARKQAKEARKAEAKRRILGGGGDVIGGGKVESGGGQSGAGAEGVVVEAHAVSEDEAGAMESGEGEGAGGMHIMHATIAVPDISESHPLPPAIQPAELTDQVRHPHHPPSHAQRELQTIAEHSSKAAPSPPPPAAGEGRGSSKRGSKKEERGEGSVKLPPI